MDKKWMNHGSYGKSLKHISWMIRQSVLIELIAKHIPTG
jgi:hypothetical protein